MRLFETRGRELGPVRRALAAAIALAGILMPQGAAGAGTPRSFDADILARGASPRAIVGFDHAVEARTISRLAAAGITHAVVLDTIDAVGVLGPPSAYLAVARWPDVTYVDDDSRLRFLNFSSKKDTRVTDVRRGRAPLRHPYTGKGVTVAIVDTGIDYTHPDLDDRVVKNVNFEPGWFFDMINDGLYSDQVAEATGSPIDTYGHGTFVAGVVAGTGEAGAGADFSGVAPGASLVNLKIADVHEGLVCDVPCDLGWEINALVAYEWMIEHRNDPAFPGGIRVANNSWSIFEADSEVEPITLIVKAAAERGIVNVFAAGNDGPDPNTVAPGPNSLEEVITVAAACKTAGYEETQRCRRGQIASFSSRGPQIDVVAPGVTIYSAMAHVSALGPISGHMPPPGPSDPVAFAGNMASYFGASGTSAAAPHVSGIVALMLEANPRLTPAQVERILIASAMDRGKRGFDTSWGFGLVNAHRAVAMAETRVAGTHPSHH